MDGVTVGVIGAVTEETPSLVSPGGITELDFGDPVDAVNRVAAQLTDGDAANGEADVLVASFHEGAGEGTAERRRSRRRSPRAARSRTSSTQTSADGRRDLHRPHPQAVRVGGAGPRRRRQDPADRADRAATASSSARSC